MSDNVVFESWYESLWESRAGPVTIAGLVRFYSAVFKGSP
jgi:hypothetical protein